MRDFLRNQFQNLFLWTPFAMAFGAATYFSAAYEPNIAYPLAIAVLVGMILIFRQTSTVTTTILLLIFGFFYAAGFTRFIDTPQINRTQRNIIVSGTAQNLDYTDDKARVFIKIPANQINRDLPENKNALVRVSTDLGALSTRPGDNITARVTLFKPSAPDAPGTFDYAAWTYFNGISATGYINEIIQTSGGGKRIFDINNLRDYIHNKSNSFLSDTLVLGYKNAVPHDDGKTWTATGVGHVWSISGFHMTLVSTWLFAMFYLIFRSIAPIARRIPARYPAMICAWFGLLFYLFLSGTDVATVRAFLMTSLIFAAFIFGRNPISLRNICIAFIAIFLMNPHYVMQTGFQLSFAAIFGLVWYFGDYEYARFSFWKKILRIIRAAILTSLIATIFTAPFVAYHFYSLQIYSLIGNLILLPVFSFAIMPLVIIGVITAVFGVTAPLGWAESIYDWMLPMAEKISALPFAQLQIPQISGFALGLIIIGFLCLMFIKNTVRHFRHMNIILFSVFVFAGVTLAATAPRPMFYTTDDHELVAFVYDGKLEFNKSSASNHYFAFETWKKLNNENTDTKNKRRKCDKGVCIYKTKNWQLAYIQKYVPLARDIAGLCRNPEINFIVSYFDIDAKHCEYKILRSGFVIYESGKIKYTTQHRWWHGSR